MTPQISQGPEATIYPYGAYDKLITFSTFLVMKSCVMFNGVNFGYWMLGMIKYLSVGCGILAASTAIFGINDVIKKSGK